MASTVHLPEDLAEIVEDRLPALGERPDPLEAFIGCGASGTRDPFDVHAARTELAGRKLAEGA